MCWSSLRLESHKPAPTFENTREVAATRCWSPNPSLWLELGPDGRDTRDSRARTEHAGDAHSQGEPCTALVGQTCTASSQRPTGPEPFPPSSAKPSLKLWLPLFLEPRLRQCIGLGFHFWSIICTIYPLN